MRQVGELCLARTSPHTWRPLELFRFLKAASIPGQTWPWNRQRNPQTAAFTSNI